MDILSALIITGVAAILLAGAFVALSGAFTREGGRDFVDADADGAPDVPESQKIHEGWPEDEAR